MKILPGGHSHKRRWRCIQSAEPGRKQIQTALHVLQVVVHQVEIELEFGQGFGIEIGMTIEQFHQAVQDFFPAFA